VAADQAALDVLARGVDRPGVNRFVLGDLRTTLGVKARWRPARFDHRLKQTRIDYWLRAPVRS
jgi:hypothetical protein